jgi:hypothetical protein
MPRLIVPSNGGGTKLTRTLLGGEAEGVCAGAGEAVLDSSGEIERAGDSSDVTEAIGLGDSCAMAIPMASHAAAINDPRFAIRDLNIVAPVHVWKKIIAPFAVVQEFFIDIVCDELIVQAIESNKVICDALRCVFTRGPGFHQECPITGLRQQKFASELFEHTIH